MNLFLKRLGGFYKYRFLMQQLVTKDIKLKYRRSFLGLPVEYPESSDGYGYHGNRIFQYVPV